MIIIISFWLTFCHCLHGMLSVGQLSAQCSHWWKFCQNNDMYISWKNMFTMRIKSKACWNLIYVRIFQTHDILYHYNDCFVWTNWNYILEIWISIDPKWKIYITHRGHENLPSFRRRHFQLHFLESKQISLKFFPKVPIKNIPVLVQIMGWCQLGDKPLSEPMMT